MLGLVFPTHVGVFLLRGRILASWKRLPHARGGVSRVVLALPVLYLSSPRTWGCFCPRNPVGARRRGLPHARGGVSDEHATALVVQPVFPTHVGVFPGPSGCGQANAGLPHARGGVSYFGSLSEEASMSSPRTWGCFQRDRNLFSFGLVFPTHVGVFLVRPTLRYPWPCLPHARGGVSIGLVEHIRTPMSSPRTWGCFRRRERDEYDYDRLPHARGGVSIFWPCVCGRAQSSPRTWGCFQSRLHAENLRVVFPTHVGVFPGEGLRILHCQRLPHARGGVSALSIPCLVRFRSSPRTWGCFLNMI